MRDDDKSFLWYWSKKINIWVWSGFIFCVCSYYSVTERDPRHQSNNSALLDYVRKGLIERGQTAYQLDRKKLLCLNGQGVHIRLSCSSLLLSHTHIVTYIHTYTLTQRHTDIWNWAPIGSKLRLLPASYWPALLLGWFHTEAYRGGDALQQRDQSFCCYSKCQVGLD